jgi:hypothetical protein
MSSTTAVEMRKQVQYRTALDLLIANMDPAMKARFDAVTASISKSITMSVETVVAIALKDTKSRLDGFLMWKPDHDTRVADLQLAVG